MQRPGSHLGPPGANDLEERDATTNELLLERASRSMKERSPFRMLGLMATSDRELGE